MRTRVVFIPGILGSVLADEQLQGWSGAESRCRENLDYLLDTALSVWAKAFVQNANPCGPPHNPAVLWGEYGMLHWLFDTEGWVRRMSRGNGIDNGHGVVLGPPTRDHGLTKLTVTAQALGVVAQLFAGPFTAQLNDKVIDPYGPMIRMLKELERQRKVDLVVFAYDWRLSNAYNATVLAQVVKGKWWPNTTSEQFARLTPDRDSQITVIAHSMGGLVARYFIEASRADVSYIKAQSVRTLPLEGHRLVRRLITIGTPHLGAPESYLSFIGAVNPLEFQSDFLNFLRSQVYLPKLFDLAVKAESKLASRGADVLLPSAPEAAREDPRAGEVPVQGSEVRALTGHMSSLVEMFPAWDFTTPRASNSEITPALMDVEEDARAMYEYFYEQTTDFGRKRVRQRPLLHAGSSHRPWSMFQQFRRRLVPPACLDNWLKARDVHYHVVASLEHEVISGYGPRTNPRIHKQEAGGDGRVPGMSALIYPWTGNQTNYIERSVVRSGDSHAMLCQSAAALDICRDLVDPARLKARARRLREVPPIARFEDLKGLTDRIINSAGHMNLPSRIIISVATIRFLPVPSPGLFANWFANGRPIVAKSEYRRSTNPWNTIPWDVGYESGRQSIGRRRVVGIGAQEKNLWRPLGLGGAVFLPESPCQDNLEVLAWNLGDNKGASLSRGVTNSTHAEVQLARWFVDRFGPWLNRQVRRYGQPLLHSVDIANRGRGDSPCAMCQKELREVAKWITDHTDLHEVGTLSWERVYGSDFYSAASGPTYLADLALTKQAGWNIDKKSPPPKK